MTAEIASIDHLGVMIVQFNETVNSFNVTSLNASDLDIYIDPTIKKQEFRNLSVLNFTWEARSLFKNLLEIKVNFSNEVELSPYAEQDRIVLHFLKDDIFST